MRIEDSLLGQDRQNSWTFKKKKDQKSFKEHLDECLENKKSQVGKEVKKRILDTLA